jgi:hypothetical protein
MASYAELKFKPTGKRRYCPHCRATRLTKISTTTIEWDCYVEACKRCGNWLIKWPKKTYDDYIR